ncbi:MAG: ATP-binding protein, partial [Acidobacteriota bacterium]
MRKLTLRHIGQIKNAEIEFGDLTVLVGPQATGKSIFLQFFKLLIDSGHILAELKKHGLDWKKEKSRFLDIYFGEGMHGLWRSHSQILVEDIVDDFDKLISRQRKDKNEKLFFIPAQRVLTLGKGWPRPFTDYSPGDPFVVRQFSDHLRLLMEKGFGESDKLFPRTGRLKTEIRDLLQETV